MDILLARILKYLNGALTKDAEYDFAVFVVNNYLNILDKDLNEVIKMSGISEEVILGFIRKLGFIEYDSFQRMLENNDQARLDQIRARMLDINSKEFVAMMEKDVSDEEMLERISEICDEIYKSKRVFLIGALYPLSITVEFQTDLITFGKPVFQFHHFDADTVFGEGDLVINISATGRSMNGFIRATESKNIKLAKKLLITQNPVYEQPEHKISDYVLRLPGKFDGIFFNYQLMTIFDLLRVHYYQQYYL